MSADWLPPLLLFVDCGGEWNAYEEALYECFKEDFLHARPQWPGKRVNLKRHPLSKGKEATFWHFISEGAVEEERQIDLRRCERIRWARAVMDAFTGRRPVAGDRILWWKTERRGEERYVLALPDFSYVLVVADRGKYVLPWTQYHVDRPHRQAKYRREYADYWKGQKS